MKKFLAIGGALALLATAPAVWAHPGHDHGHWLSDAIHFLSIAAVVVGIVAVGVAFKLRNKHRASISQSS